MLDKIKVINIAKIKGRGPQKGKSILGYKYRRFTIWTPALVNLVAHILFDGAIKSGGILYYNRSCVLINNFRNKMANIYNGKPRTYTSYNGVKRVVYHNVELVGFLKQKSGELIENIYTLSHECQREFLKAFFDDEGSVDFRLKYKKRRIRGYQYNEKILRLVNRLLKNFGINSCIDNRFNEITITREKDIRKFAMKINFSKGLKINGKRSNSVWKKDLEKRKILENLIASYR